MQGLIGAELLKVLKEWCKNHLVILGRLLTGFKAILVSYLAGSLKPYILFGDKKYSHY